MKKDARKFHRTLWTVLGLVLPAIVLGALLIKQTPPETVQPVLLEPAEED
ncbi:MAG: hypothetical protein AAGA53_16395 [Pseudomonadota bacterium]